MRVLAFSGATADVLRDSPYARVDREPARFRSMRATQFLNEMADRAQVANQRPLVILRLDMPGLHIATLR